jgi:hypothetical protein
LSEYSSIQWDMTSDLCLRNTRRSQCTPPPPPPDRDEDTREDEEEEEEDSDSDRKHRKRDAKTYSRFDQTMEGEKGGSATGHYSAAGGGQKEAITIGKAVERSEKATRGGE